ncbi:UTP--glucose-1-phosphate uridylyltransferase GalU [Mycoplasmoides alvi]|uniref:UTP--glucose-1-phosphate uridylyltransferase GalU n=1 Tax=Mycoplasmoides alvi TaxID=78580 RepID=UPI00051C27BA|nr:UTP--glucose-1-phosphate uridylyltransferase GalU [Mycoplasmoides alvi]
MNSNIKIKKAVIPAAGLGTRFLPATKAMPKEMLPIVDKPAIQYIVEEAVNSGIEEILIITSSSKNAIIDHFDYSYELENRLKLKKKENEFKQIRDIADMANIQYIRQKEPLGLGHAIYCAKSFINNEPFAILLGDDIVVPNKQDKPALLQCIEAFNELKGNILGVQQVPNELVHKYGIINPSKDINKSNLNKGLIPIKDVVEKPSPEHAPSNYAILGRYILNPEIFCELENIKPDIRDELELTDAIFKLSKYQKIYAKVFTGNRYDIGSKLGFITATIDSALRHKDIKDDVKKIILKCAHEINKQENKENKKKKK